MCFSAQASFTASTILLVIGLYSIANVKSSNQIMLASVPLLFAIQQFCEGVLWLTLSYDTLHFLSTIMTYGFLFFALIIWPSWIPYTLFVIEPNKISQTILKIFTIIGLTISIYFLYSLIIHGSQAQIMENHICYNYQASFYQVSKKAVVLLYCIPVVGSFFVASMPIFTLFGLVLLGSILLTNTFWKLYFTSVWCFFAALLSMMVIFVLKQLNKKSEQLH